MSIAHLRLSIDVASDPISGSLHTDNQQAEPFCGWVELAAAIEALRAPGLPETGRNPRVTATKD
jgi:hypothetical protein